MSSSSSEFRSSTIYFVLGAVIVLAAAAYGWLQYGLLRAEQQATSDNISRISQLKKNTASTESQYKKLAETSAPSQAEFLKKIATILPQDENYTELTRMFDAFFADNDKQNSPIFESSLRYGKSAPVDGMPGISALPISMNIEGSRENFFKFLEFIKNSGSLETGVRLMAVNSIQLNFPEGGEILQDPYQKINFTLDMNAYYQTPEKVAR